MRLGFDATSLGPTGKGLSRFQGEFLRTAATIGAPEDLVVFVDEEADESLLPHAHGFRYVPVRTRPMLRWEQLGLPRAARRERLDVVLTLSERAALVGPPRVVYVFEHPRRRARLNRVAGVGVRQRLVDRITVALFQLSVRRAAELAVGSESTAADLAGIRSAHVVYPGVSEVFRPDEARTAVARAEFDAPSGYFLHLTSDDPRDNTSTALAAYSSAGDLPPLVLGGGPRETVAARRAEVQRLGIAARVRWAGFRSEEALADLYRGAIAYVDPSLHEGFGLQAAEALACGTPVIASNVTSLPEVVGPAGVLLAPDDVAGFAGAMRHLYESPDVRAELARLAAQRGADFSWERTVRSLLRLCENARAARPPTRA